MIPLSPALLIAAANAFVGINASSLVPDLLREVREDVSDGILRPWDTAFVHHVGYWSHFDAVSGTSSWPLAPSCNGDELSAYAEEWRALRDTPERGDLYLVWSPVHDAFVRTGIVVDIGYVGTEPNRTSYVECVTIEGDTDERMTHGGPLAMRFERKLSAARGDRFVRWTALDVRQPARAPACEPAREPGREPGRVVRRRAGGGASKPSGTELEVAA